VAVMDGILGGMLYYDEKLQCVTYLHPISVLTFKSLIKGERLIENWF